eukprot:scaffold117568_cov66-Phaeocystis_antarctica.AAC.4
MAMSWSCTWKLYCSTTLPGLWKVTRCASPAATRSLSAFQLNRPLEAATSAGRSPAAELLAAREGPPLRATLRETWPRPLRMALTTASHVHSGCASTPRIMSPSLSCPSAPATDDDHTFLITAIPFASERSNPRSATARFLGSVTWKLCEPPSLTSR